MPEGDRDPEARAHIYRRLDDEEEWHEANDGFDAQQIAQATRDSLASHHGDRDPVVRDPTARSSTSAAKSSAIACVTKSISINSPAARSKPAQDAIASEWAKIEKSATVP